MHAAALSDDASRMLRASLWAQGLDATQLARVEAEVDVRGVAAGATIWHRGEAASHWLGIVEGIVKVDNVAADGRATTFAVVPAGGWVGEGSLLKNEARPYAVVAMRACRVVLMPRATFVWLLDTSLPFNRFLIDHLNARLGQFVAQVERDRLRDHVARVACCLAELFNPQLYPQTDTVVAISQEEIGRLSGISRQQANQALGRLEQAGLLRVHYGSVEVRDVDGLRHFAGPN